ncbi:hypothetical protein [Acetobacter thailandicus]|uniref:hypothetical protein n=1 Tax=Acetobacter thailandicus TaxID=1502842 RepID=UPI001BA755B1|nr:hypothetical protein [Acetobacter thailandicus]MBS0980904.1 hypothetical protein [Acetobacter thailandicus]
MNEETMSTMRLAIVSLQKELNRRAENAQKDKNYLKELHDKNTDLKIRLAIAEALLAERDHPTFTSNVEGKQKSGIPVNERGEC